MRIQGTDISPVTDFFFRFIYFMCMYAWPTYMYGYRRHSWWLWRPEKSTRSPEIGVMDDCEPPCGCWESNMGPLHEQQVLSHCAIFSASLALISTIKLVSSVPPSSPASLGGNVDYTICSAFIGTFYGFKYTYSP